MGLRASKALVVLQFRMHKGVSRLNQLLTVASFLLEEQ